MRQVQQRLAKQAGSREAGDQTALGQMLTLLLQLGQTMKAQGGSTAPIGFAHLLKMWAQQSNLKPQPSRRGLDRWASLHLDTELHTALLLLLLHQQLQHWQISWRGARRLHRCDGIMDGALAEAKAVLWTLQAKNEQLKSKLRRLLQEDVLCFDLCGADLKGLTRDSLSILTKDRHVSVMRNTIRSACEGLARAQQRSLTSIAE